MRLTALQHASRRFLRHHPWQLMLALLGVMLGVAMVTAVDLANNSSAHAFRLSMESVNGTATHQIVSTPAGLEEGLYLKLRLELGLRDSVPLVEAYGRSMGEVLHLLGIDPLARPGMQPALGSQDRETLATLLSRGDSVLLAAATAARLGVAPGDHIEVQVGGRRQRLLLAGLLTGEPQAALDGLMVMDIATAQEISAQLGVLSRIDLKLPPGAAGERRLAEIRALLPDSARLVTAASRGTVQLQMSQAFHTNLRAMSLLALLVGMFLVYNTMSFLVLQRRHQLGILRLLGITRRELLRLLLTEGLLLGSLATLLGLGLGVLAGEGLVQLISRTINDLYFQVTVNRLHVNAATLLKASLLGVAGTLLATLPAALEASAARPGHALQRSRLESGSHRLATRLAGSGCTMMVAAAALLSLAGSGLAAGFAALFFIMLGFALLVPWLTGKSAVALARQRCFPSAKVLDRLAIRGVDAGLSRTGMAVAALMLALAATVGVGTMINSFRSSVIQWLEDTLHADIYVSVPGLGPGRANGALDSSLMADILSLPQLRGHSSGRRVVLEKEGELTQLFALGLSPGLQPRYALKASLPTPWQDFQAGIGVLISEPLSLQRGLAAGDTIVLPTDHGDQLFPILGVYYDYASPQGQVLITRALYERHFRDRGTGGLGLYLRDRADLTTVMETVRKLAAKRGQAVKVRSNRGIREHSLSIFDRSFVITRVLRLLAVAVAFLAVLGALLALQLERRREAAILRAGGATPGDIIRMVLVQTGFMGLLAGLLALPAGLLLSWLLIHVINRRAFGWTMSSQVSAEPLVGALVLALLAALLAALYPAWRLSRFPPARDLREE
ncbi:MAG: ABC transporter permease [Gammaproteobacteria bacterium]